MAASFAFAPRISYPRDRSAGAFRGLIEATEPPEYRGVARDAVRMLVTDRRKRSHTHAHFYDLPSLLRAGDLLVVNDSATLPAALVAPAPTASAFALHVSTKIDERLWMASRAAPSLPVKC